MVLRSCKSLTNNRDCLINFENREHDETIPTSIVAQISKVLEKRKTKWIFVMIAYNIVIVHYLGESVNSTNSLGMRGRPHSLCEIDEFAGDWTPLARVLKFSCNELTGVPPSCDASALSAYANTIYFNVFALSVCLISIWVEQNNPANGNFRRQSGPTTIFGYSRLPRISRFQQYEKKFSVEHRNDENVKDEKNNNSDCESMVSLGLEKYEVFALFVSSCLSLLAGFLVSGRVVARLADQPRVHTGHLGLGTFLGFLAHLGTIIGYPDAGLNHVVCKALPCPTLRGCNPILGGNTISAIILTGSHLVIHFWEIYITDTVAAVAVLALTVASMYPLAFYTLNVMFQQLPRHMNEQLDKCLREALIIDGVLEFRNERFWTKSFGKLAGTLQVRVRRNANENYVLERVMLRLSKIVSTLAIQEYHESRTNDLLPDVRPSDYYVNEILSSRDNCIDNAPYNSNCPSFSNEIVGDSCFVKIEDVINFGSLKIDHYYRPDEGAENFLDEKSSSKLATLKNDNIIPKNHLWRDDLTNVNSLLRGTKVDCEKFKDFFVFQ